MTEMESVEHQLGTVTQYFTVDDADELIKFIIGVFNGYLVKENRYENGVIQHARIQLGNSIIMLNHSSEEYPANVSQTHLYVNDVEITYKSALLSGATSIMEPNLRPHGDKMAGITDPCGNIWWLAGHAD